jgi:hypothetical protein
LSQTSKVRRASFDGISLIRANSLAPAFPRAGASGLIVLNHSDEHPGSYLALSRDGRITIYYYGLKIEIPAGHE